MPKALPSSAALYSPDPSIASTLFPVYDCGSLVTLMPLSYDWTALKNNVDSMTPNGNSNVTIGLVWAWHSLTTQAPVGSGGAGVRSRQGHHPADRRRQHRVDVQAASQLDSAFSAIAQQLANLRIAK